MQIIVFVSIATNIGVVMTSGGFGIKGSVVAFFILEHICLLVWIFFYLYIPPMPGAVRKELAKSHFHLQ